MGRSRAASQAAADDPGQRFARFSAYHGFSFSNCLIFNSIRICSRAYVFFLRAVLYSVAAINFELIRAASELS